MRSSNSDPNTAQVQLEQDNDDNEYFVNYAQTHLHQHAHGHQHTHRRHSHHVRRPSQQHEQQRPLSRGSIVSISNPEYFYGGSNGTLNGCSCTNSKASLITSKASSRDHLIHSTDDGYTNNDIEELYHYSRINTVPRRLPTPPRLPPSPPPPLPQKNQGMKQSPSDNHFKPIDPDMESSSYAESSMTQTTDKNTGTVIHGLDDEPLYNTNSLSDNSYATINDENRSQTGKRRTQKSTASSRTQSIYNYTYVDLDNFGAVGGKPKAASSLKILTPTKFTVESYTLPLQHRRHRSCGSSDSFDDIDIPEYFSSPSRIRWNFLTGLPDRSRSQSRIGSSRNSNEFKTDDEQGSKESVCKVDEMLRKKSSQSQKDKTVSIWHTNGTADDCNAIIFHHDSELVENCCKNHFQQGETSGGSSSTGTTRPRSSSSSSSKRDKRAESECKDDDMEIYEFELCTMENCEYLLKSSQLPIESPPLIEPQQLLNNQIDKENISSQANKNKNSNPQNMKYNKLKKKPSKKSKRGAAEAGTSGSTSSLKNDDFVTLNQLNYAYFIKKDTNNLNNVNLKPNSNSSSQLSLDAINTNANILNNQCMGRRNKLNYLNELRQLQLQQQPLNIRSLLLASTSSTSRNGNNYFYNYNYSNPNLAENSMSSASATNMMSTMTSSLNNINNNYNNNGCQFINNNINNNNSNLINTNTNNNNTNLLSNSSNTNTNAYQSSLSNTINSNNNDNNNNNIMQRPLARWRYNQYNINGLLRNVRKRARQYVSSLWTREDETDQ